jgi:hypothetical protein
MKFVALLGAFLLHEVMTCDTCDDSSNIADYSATTSLRANDDTSLINTSYQTVNADSNCQADSSGIGANCQTNNGLIINSNTFGTQSSSQGRYVGSSQYTSSNTQCATSNSQSSHSGQWKARSFAGKNFNGGGNSGLNSDRISQQRLLSGNQNTKNVASCSQSQTYASDQSAGTVSTQNIVYASGQSTGTTANQPIIYATSPPVAADGCAASTITTTATTATTNSNQDNCATIATGCCVGQGCQATKTLSPPDHRT